MCDTTTQLQCVSLDALTVAERTVFFINIYNALVVHALVAKGQPKSVFDKLVFFNTASYDIGGNAYTCDDVEHGVLRGNRYVDNRTQNTTQHCVAFARHPPRLRVVVRSFTPPTHVFSLNRRPTASSIGALVGQPWLSRGPFGPTDPRRPMAMHPVDPRIHFALVCGAKSCPPIRVYDAVNLDAQLEAAAAAFVEVRAALHKTT